MQNLYTSCKIWAALHKSYKLSLKSCIEQKYPLMFVLLRQITRKNYIIIDNLANDSCSSH